MREIMHKHFQRLSVLASVTISILMSSSLCHAADWYNTSWKYRQKIMISSTMTDSDLTDFPALIKITDSSNQLFSKAKDNGDDILFTQQDGTTKLSHEIEKYSSSENKLECWVKVPNIYSTLDTVIYMYYGNSDSSNQEDIPNVWDDNYVGVWHLHEGDSTGTDFYKDATGNVNHGTLTDADGDTNQADGKIHKAMNFNGDADYIDCGNDATLGIGTKDFTLSAWIKAIMLGKNWTTF